MKRLTLKWLASFILALPFVLASCDEGSDDSQKNMLLLMTLANSGVANITWYNLTSATTFDVIGMVTPEEWDAWVNYGDLPQDYLDGLLEPGDEKRMSIKETGFHQFCIFNSSSLMGCYGTEDIVEGVEYVLGCDDANLHNVSVHFP